MNETKLTTSNELMESYSERDMYAVELFGVPEKDLNVLQKSKFELYMYDIVYPKWKQIIYDGIATDYEISNTGLCRKIDNKQTLSPVKTVDGYLKYRIRVAGEFKQIFAHRLVGYAFTTNPYNYPQIDHLNGDKTLNWVGNLEWVTAKENTRRAMEMGLKWFNLGLKGEDNLTHVYTEEQIRQTCKLMEENPLMLPWKITEQTGVPRWIIYQLRKGNSWTHIAHSFKLRDVNFRYGELNPNNTYSEDQIHAVCKLLEENPRMNHRVIEEMTGVHHDTVARIRKGKTWKDISKFYNIDPVDLTIGENRIQAVYTNAQIKQVCDMLMDSLNTYEHIKDITGVNIDTISRIFKGKYWQSIAGDYKFPARQLPHRDDIHQYIADKLIQGISNGDIVNDVLSQEKWKDKDRRKIQLMVSSVKGELKEKGKLEVSSLSND